MFITVDIHNTGSGIGNNYSIFFAANFISCFWIDHYGFGNGLFQEVAYEFRHMVAIYLFDMQFSHSSVL